jgi:hypothetical protein
MHGDSVALAGAGRSVGCVRRRLWRQERSGDDEQGANQSRKHGLKTRAGSGRRHIDRSAFTRGIYFMAAKCVEFWQRCQCMYGQALTRLWRLPPVSRYEALRVNISPYPVVMSGVANIVGPVSP